MLVVSSFWLPCDHYVVGSMPVSLILGIMICLLLVLFPQLLLCHLWMSKMTLFLVILHFCCLAIPLCYVVWCFVGGHFWLVPDVFLVKSCSLECLLLCITLMFIFMPSISSSLFSLWFCLDSQSAMKRSGSDLYIVLTLCWWILSGMHCNLWDSIAKSLLKFLTKGFWSVIILTSLAKQ